MDRQTDQTQANATSIVRSLRTRLLFFLAISLTPFLALAANQSRVEYLEDREARRAILLIESRQATERAGSAVEATRGMLEGLRSQGAVIAGGDDCQFALRSVLLSRSHYGYIGTFAADGSVGCASSESPDDLNVSGSAWFEDVRAGAEFAVGRLTYGALSRRYVVVAATPIMDAEGDFAGAIAASIVVAELPRLGSLSGLPEGSSLAIIDAEGELIRATDGFPSSAVEPALAQIELSAGQRAELLTFNDEAGESHYAAIDRLIGDDLYVVIVAPTGGLLSGIVTDAATSFALAVFMWLLALMAVWLSTDRLVLRWLSYLRRLARIYGSGRLDVSPIRARQAPGEIAELADAMGDMAERIAARETELRDSLEQKHTLLKEIHHRVKNNLQIIVSLLNIQINSVRSPEAKKTLEEARGRINALAIVHKSLYELEDLRLVSLPRFFKDLGHQLSAASGAGEASISFVTEIEDVRLAPDHAVPLALFVTEAGMNAFKHAFDGRTQGTITVQLKRIEDDQIMVSIEDDGVGAPEEAPSIGTGSSLMAAFARQLGGRLESDAANGGGHSVRLVFPEPDAPVADDHGGAGF